MILTNENYYSVEANRHYMSVSQYKEFKKCEASAMAQISGEWVQPTTTALLVGSYIDAWFEGTLDEFCLKHPEIFKRDGSLKADYVQAEELIEFVQRDPVFMEYMAGEKQVIRTRELFGVPWKIKIDSYHPNRMIVDGKVMRSMERIMGKSFVEHWGYDLQMAVYSAVEGSDLDTYLAVVTKEDPPDKDVIHIPKWRRDELLAEIEKDIPHIVEVKSGKTPPQRCGVCKYCRATKMITEPIDFELVGLSTAERRAILGG
ncbi:MAG: PD-(D/E)XK nuclease-like domain-containing protein [Clostridia bacterium]|nr:PD-(D/E)XK nuclease-like domain-containing protein [Clostridia bacterium]